ncbi:MAG TPA: HU family DNA-binding protein [Nakamurella sp.]
MSCRPDTVTPSFGFGVFEKRARAARSAGNPRTGEAVRKTNVSVFRPGRYFREVIAGPVKLPKVSLTPASRRCRPGRPLRPLRPSGQPCRGRRRRQEDDNPGRGRPTGHGRHRWDPGGRFRRPAIAAERQLLAELGYPGDLTGLATSVDYVSSVRHRAWPNPEPTPTPRQADGGNTR